MYSASIRRAIVLLALLASIVSVPADAPVVRWGDAQEGIQVGIALMEGFGRNGALAIHARPATNYAKNLVVPELSQAIGLVLRDSSNNVVKPKPDGTKFGAPLQTKMSGRSRTRQELRFLDLEGWVLGGVKIDDCYLVKEKQDYELEIRVRLLKEAGENLVPVLFTPIKIILHLVPNTAKPPPLRVKGSDRRSVPP